MESSLTWIPCIPKSSSHVVDHTGEPLLLKEVVESRGTTVETIFGFDAYHVPLPPKNRHLFLSNKYGILGDLNSSGGDETAISIQAQLDIRPVTSKVTKGNPGVGTMGNPVLDEVNGDCGKACSEPIKAQKKKSKRLVCGRPMQV